MKYLTTDLFDHTQNPIKHANYNRNRKQSKFYPLTPEKIKLDNLFLHFLECIKMHLQCPWVKVFFPRRYTLQINFRTLINLSEYISIYLGRKKSACFIVLRRRHKFWRYFEARDLNIKQPSDEGSVQLFFFQLVFSASWLSWFSVKRGRSNTNFFFCSL
jgi:hypothetical protein